MIQCTSRLDKESCIYADKVRALRQQEYDTAVVYSDREEEMIAQNERLEQDFIEYFKSIIYKCHPNSSNSIIVNWTRVGELLSIFSEGKPIPFKTISVKLLENLKLFMLSAPQRKWDTSQWECKLDDPERNYDPSREHLNFEIRKGGVIASVDKTICIKQKVDERIAEWKAERLSATGVEPKTRSTQHLSVSLVIGGNTELMNKLAFGEQELQERGHNAHIKRMPEIEQFAIDNYNALAKKVGEKNIISFICHCDEKGCHIHAIITPILEDGRLCAKDMF